MIHILFLFLIMVSACTNRADNVSICISEESFIKSTDLSYEKLYTDYLISYPKNIVLTKEHLIIQDDRGHNLYYHGVNKKSLKLDFEYGEKNSSPTGMLSTSINPFYDKNKNEIQMFDINKKTIFYKSVEGNKIISNKIDRVSDNGDLFIEQVFDYGNFYLMTGQNDLFENYRFITCNSSFNVINKFESYPVLSEDKTLDENIKKSLFNIAFLKSSPNKENIVFASYEVGLLEIFDGKKLPDQLVKKKSILLNKPLNNNNEKIFGFEDIYVTDNYIYALYNGNTVDENPYYAKRIMLFDWEGNFIIQYNVDLDLRCLAIDENEKRIYAIAYTDDDGFFIIKTEIIEYL